MGGPDNSLSMLCLSSTWLLTAVSGGGGTAIPMGSDPEEVFDVAMWLLHSILTAYCNTICSTAGL